MSEIAVLVASNYAVVREGFRSFIEAEPDMQVVGMAADSAEAMNQAVALEPQVVVLDLEMGVKSNPTAAQGIKTGMPQTHILIVIPPDQSTVGIKGYADGYLLKNFSAAELAQAIRDVCLGRFVLQSQLALQLMENFRKPRNPSPPSEPLTEREREILRLVAQGKSNLEIAEDLVVSERTVRTHVSHILEKLRLVNRTQAALYALRRGIAELE